MYKEEFNTGLLDSARKSGIQDDSLESGTDKALYYWALKIEIVMFGVIKWVSKGRPAPT